MDTERIDALLREPVDARFKGLPDRARGLPVSGIAGLDWNALSDETYFPLLLIRDSALRNNLAAMQAFCRRHGVDLAPHGKTTMSPQLFARQSDHGCWAITAANASQVRTYREYGVARVLLANELADVAALRWIAGELTEDPGFDFCCYVDSVDGVDRMDRVLDEARPSRPLPVLLELGYAGGRTGCRTVEEALRVAAAVRDSHALELVGVAGFEGLINVSATSPEEITVVDAYLATLVDAARALDAAGYFRDRPEVVLSAGGSAYFDRVVAALTTADLSVPTRIVLRSGCYLTHDHEMYAGPSPLAGRRPPGETLALRPALELWGTVWSRPEPDLAILGFGKRDASYDYRLPLPLWSLDRERAGRRDLDERYRLTQLSDQHAFLRLPSGDPLSVGDLVGCGLSHPCTAFDKWSLIPIVDDDDVVVDVVRTLF